MAKSLLLVFCCAFLTQGLWAQTPRRDTAIPQKLEFKKAGPGRAAHPAYFTKKASFGDTDTSRSLMYMRSGKRDSVQLGLPARKNKKIDFQIKATQREPLFRRQ
ncbi:hypothetical protein Q4E93_09605 [Flavitalea sp. BT771]|uniref:hypothetical protein n=1 Tax=Flavitalea sp. BT771 TaxID=3063329 RepID=UPI0026E13DFE|nr:hypothetical protein [Flavitalea sp. BT771]MDO6430845.1 hypothetical protein [Flavitalea sp. BT771]MDV6219015.1 hypothetical protein [Flavitalea sp. BT771]